MKIFNVKQIREWDVFTIQNEPISSMDLMERAAKSCFDKIQERYVFNSYAIFCGPGNNGGDGLVIARYLLENELSVRVFIPDFTENYSEDFKKNLKKLPADVIESFKQDQIPNLSDFDCLIDAIFGSGLARPLEGFLKSLVDYINTQELFKIAVDVPSGMYSDIDQFPIPECFVQADHVYTFQIKKAAFFNEDIRREIGAITVVDIGLDETYAERQATDMFEIDEDSVQLFEINRFTHKFQNGFALIIGGSRGKYGAPILSSKACLRTGAGLVSIAIPEEGRSIAHQSMSELMLVDSIGEQYIKQVHIPDKVNAIGAGPGMGTNNESVAVLEHLFQLDIPLVLDADALNIIAENPDLWKKLPDDTIITPHQGEFERLFGKVGDENKYEILRKQARENRICIVLKGAITTIASSDGDLYFLDEVGNQGMATAGSGDVLTGIITSLLAQGYTPIEASAYGVYLHGLAGDLALENETHQSLVASDIINHIGQAIKNLTE